MSGPARGARGGGAARHERGARGPRYFVDGYNVILRLGLGAEQSLAERRAELLARIAATGFAAYVAFDSREAVHGVRATVPRRIEVAFARSGRSADELLIEKVRRESDLAHVIVVSDDREVAERCRFLGARTRSAAEFGRMLKPAPAPGSARDRRLSPGEVKEWMEWLGLDATGERKERRRRNEP